MVNGVEAKNDIIGMGWSIEFQWMWVKMYVRIILGPEMRKMLRVLIQKGVDSIHRILSAENGKYTRRSATGVQNAAAR